VFAAFFHLYRYAMSQEKNAPPPPPPPVLVQEEKPKLAEPDVTAEPSKLAEDNSTKEKSEPKELSSEVPTPKIQADLGVGTNDNQNLGSGDLTKP
jgi:ubiquinol-cytochrome c reductase cytochrome b subunit